MRPELIHPMVVHFPIALLITGVVLRLVSLWTAKKPKLAFLLPASWVVLALGVIGAWVAVFFGEIAQDIVKPTLQDSAVLEVHQIHAYTTAWGFTFVLLIDWTRAYLIGRLRKNNRAIKEGLAVVVWLVYLFSLSNLILTGFYGGTLVYEEGAAIQNCLTR